MTKFEVSGTIFKEVNEIIEAKDEMEAGQAFFTLFGFYPDAVGEKSVVGTCESCPNLIFEGDKYGSDEDGTYLCDECCSKCLQYSNGL